MARLTTLILAGSKRSAMGAPHPQRPSEPRPWPLRTVESPMRMSEGSLGLAGPVRPGPASCVLASGGMRGVAGGVAGVVGEAAGDAGGGAAVGGACWAARASRGTRQVMAAARRAWLGRVDVLGMIPAFGSGLARGGWIRLRRPE